MDPLQRGKTPTKKKKKNNSSGDLENVEYSFTDIAPRSILTQIGSTC